MAMFGFVYLWYLMVVLVLEIWFDYRTRTRATRRASTGVKRWFYGLLTVWSDDISPEALRLDDRLGVSADDHRHSVGLSAAWLRRLHLRLGQGQPLVVDVR